MTARSSAGSRVAAEREKGPPGGTGRRGSRATTAATALAALLAAAAPRAARAGTACSDLFTVDLRKPSAGATAYSDLFTIDLRRGRADATLLRFDRLEDDATMRREAGRRARAGVFLQDPATFGLADPGEDWATRRGTRAGAPSIYPGPAEPVGISLSPVPPASSSACRR